MTDENRRLRVFFSSSFADRDARQLREALSDQFDIVSPDALVGSFARHTALNRALDDVDVVVVALPPPEDPAAANVFVEAGAALGAGRPVLLVGELSQVPADLANLPAQAGRSAPRIADDIRLIASSKSPMLNGPSTMSSRGPGLSSVVVDRLRRRIRQREYVAAEAAGIIDDLFRAAGARTKNALVVGHKVTDAADLAVWHDDLTASLGTPLPVEILVRRSAWPAVRQRLERTLAMSGGRTLIALYLGEPTDVPRKWSDGRRWIVVAAADQLLDELAENRLAIALAHLLDRAEP